MDSSIIHIKGGSTMFAGPDAVALFRATTIKAAIGLLAKGITPTRGMTMTKALALASGITGKKYKRTEHAKAIADVQIWCNEMAAALPKEVR